MNIDAWKAEVKDKEEFVKATHLGKRVLKYRKALKTETVSK
jgi:hypothetical protein